MKTSRIAALTAILSTVFLAQAAQAASLSTTEQVTAVVDWFTGMFNNNAQIAKNPSIPPLTMENCAISAGGLGNPSAQYVHLEQYIAGSSLLRTAAYEFSPVATGVSLSVFGYLDDPSALGTCDNADPVLKSSNLETPSCDISLAFETDKFVGSNAPVGCATSFPVPNSRVVSTVTIRPDSTDSFDQFFTPFGTSFGTPIEFKRVVATPEPLSAAAFIGIGLVGLLQANGKNQRKY